MKHPLGTRQGLTLVELMVTASLLAAVGLATAQFLTTQTDFFHLSLNRMNIEDQLRIGFNQIATELAQATRSEPATAQSARVVDAQTLQFYLPADEDGDGTIVDAVGDTEWDTDNLITYQFDADENQLERVDNNGTRVLINDVAAVQFDDQDTDGTLYASEIRLQVTLQRTTITGRVVEAESTRIIHLKN
jgi:type II secretory pathway component PulJ